MCYINDNDFDIELYLAGGQGELKHMNLYLAGVKSKNQLNSQDKTIFYNTNILQSFYYADKFTENIIIPHCKNFLLDSGAFTFFSSGKKIDWIEYLNKYADFINQNNVTNFFELDIDVLVGYDKVLEFRKLLERKTNKKCIPVWHKSRGKNEYIKMCKEYDYVAIGGIVSKEISSNEYKVFPELIRIAHENNAKVHGLGFTNLIGLTKYHFDSVDSTTWLAGRRFGAVFIFNGEIMKRYDKPKGTKITNSKNVILHNFKEWVKFS